GIDERPVEPDQERKSVGTEITYSKDLTTRFEIVAELYKLEKELMERLENAQTTGRTITVKIKFSDFRQITRSHTLNTFINDFDTLHREVTSIRKTMNLEGERIRLMGVTVSNLITEDNADQQLHLFEE
ncbi:MAG: DNA polymerase IV, partial [Bacteroidia bacterium]|nr:DNA polymerase IV [Bacteroidia bacterium]